MEEDLAKRFHDLRSRLTNFRKELDTVYDEIVDKSGNIGSGEIAGRKSTMSQHKGSTNLDPVD